MTGKLVYRADIDGLRAVAVLGVVLYHAFPIIVPGGFAGVDIFFVISGYLISGVIFKGLEAGTFSLNDFYAHRIRRIFPSLALVLVVSWFLAYRLLIPVDFASFARSMLGGVGFYANFVQIGGGYFQSSEEERPLLHLWSLGVEEQFYLIWPLLLFSVWRWRPRAVPWLIAILLVSSFIDNILRTPVAPKLAFFFPDPRLWELAIGGGLAFLHFQGLELRARWRRSASLTGLVVILASLLLLNSRFAWPGWWSLLPTLGAATITGAGNKAGITHSVLTSEAAVAVGKISYPLYLWHWPLLVFGRTLLWDIPQSAIDALVLAISFALSIATYAFLEKPIRYGSLQTVKVRTLGPALAMGACAALAGVAIAGQGLPSRFPANIQAVLESGSGWDGSDIHYKQCFDGKPVYAGLRPDICVDPPSPGLPLLLVWGDSHAFALYPGLRKLQTQERRFRLAAFTKGACPFFADASTGGTSQGCKEFNAEVRQEIRRLKPDLVVVDSYWTWRKYYSEDFDVAAVRQTLLELQSYGTRNIIVVGPLPSWKTSLRRVIFREALKNSWAIPERSALALEDRFYTADAKLRQTVAGTTALYFPTLDKFCTPGGCVLMGDRLHDKPFLMDDSHLTSAGSELVASLMAPILFKRLFDQNPLGSKG